MYVYRQSFVSACIENCPKRAMLDYLQHVPHKTAFSLLVGRVFHSAVESFFKHKIATRENMSKGDMLNVTRAAFDTFLKAPEYADLDMEDHSAKIIHTNSTLMVMVMSVVNSFYTYACSIDDATGAEVDGEIYFPDIDTKITTTIDLQRVSGINDWKTARVQSYSMKGANAGREYFPDWNKGTTRGKMQHRIHRLIFEQQPYSYVVVGKGNTSLVQEFPVEESRHALDAWREHHLIPELQLMNSGIFPARVNNFCVVCPYFKMRAFCGIGL